MIERKTHIPYSSINERVENVINTSKKNAFEINNYSILWFENKISDNNMEYVICYADSKYPYCHIKGSVNSPDIINVNYFDKQVNMMPVEDVILNFFLGKYKSVIFGVETIKLIHIIRTYLKISNLYKNINLKFSNGLDISSQSVLEKYFNKYDIKIEIIK